MDKAKSIKRDSTFYIKAGGGLIALLSVAFAVFHGIKGNMIVLLSESSAFWTVSVITVAAAVVMGFFAVKDRNIIAILASAIQIAGLLWFDINIGSVLEYAATLDLDWFAVIMILITGLMGGIICWRTGGRVSLLISILAVDGMVLSDDLLWMYMFWTIIIVCAYDIVVHDRNQADECASRLLLINSLAGIGFLAGIIISGLIFETVCLTTLYLIDTIYADMISTACVFIVLAGMARSMQIPFQGWLSHEYKTSAGTASLIQAVTLVNSGAILVIKMSPAMGVSNFAGLMAIVGGGLTFFISSLNAVTEVSSRKMLADSTSSIMGLVIMCAGIGTSESVWAAVILIMFHSIAKPLLLTGTESKKLRTDVVMGVIVMMAAPFAIVLLQRESLASIVDTGNIILVMIMCFSGAIAILYWTRWLGSLIDEAVTQGIEPLVFKEVSPFKANAWLLIISIIGLPFISMYMVVPYMEELFGGMSAAANLSDNILDSVVIALAVALAAYPVYKGTEAKAGSKDRGMHTDEETREMLRKSRSTIKAQVICNILSVVIVVICIGFTAVNLAGLLGGVLQ